jgi:hypothetical protein
MIICCTGEKSAAEPIQALTAMPASSFIAGKTAQRRESVAVEQGLETVGKTEKGYYMINVST